ncbi:MAG: PIG-L family deacetylase [Deltaproteobacteria bacterium]|nr:MAG: PIG-L family deacetylase [Deltaproteobacteria bacterium]
MINSLQRILVLAPHTDDGEFGCGGSIVRLIEEGKEVFYVAFSAAEKSVPKEFPNDILKKEVREATKVLGISKENLIILSYPVRDFPLYRQEILEDMIRLNEKLKPDIVFLPSPNDTHQDHQTIAQEGFRAFKRTTILGYEIPWNNLTFNTNAFIFLEENHIRKKIEALKCYKSQMHRIYASEEFIKSLARTRGTQIGCKYAEVFEVVRWVMR